MSTIYFHIYKCSCRNLINSNCSKCKVLSFVRSNIKKLPFVYSDGGDDLENVESIKDLEVIFQKNFKFDIHMNVVTSRASSLLGILKRSTKEFRSCDSIIYLYKTLVRHILLYGTIIWSPSDQIYISMLESL